MYVGIKCLSNGILLIRMKRYIACNSCDCVHSSGNPAEDSVVNKTIRTPHNHWLITRNFELSKLRKLWAQPTEIFPDNFNSFVTLTREVQYAWLYAKFKLITKNIKRETFKKIYTKVYFFSIVEKKKMKKKERKKYIFFSTTATPRISIRSNSQPLLIYLSFSKFLLTIDLKETREKK